MHRFFVFAGSRYAGDSLIRNLVPKGYFVVEGPQGLAVFNLDHRRVGSFCSPLLELHDDYGPVQIVQELRNSDGVDVARVGDIRPRFVHGAEIEVDFVRNAVVFKLRSQPPLEVTWHTRSDKRVVLALDEYLDTHNARRIVDFLCLTESQVIEWFQSVPGMHLVVQGLEMRDPRLSFTTLRGYDKGAIRGTWMKPLAAETPSDMGLNCASPVVSNTVPRRSVFNDPNKVRLRNEPTSTIFDDPTPLKFPPRLLVSKAIDTPTLVAPSQPDGNANEARVTQIRVEYFSDAVGRETIAVSSDGSASERAARPCNSSGAVSPPMVTDISSESSDSESPCGETDALSSAESCCKNDASTKAPSPTASAGDSRCGTTAHEHPPITLSSTVFFMFFDESRDCHTELRTRMRRLGYSVDRCPVYPNTLAVRNEGVVIARFHNPSLVVDLPPPEVRRLLASFEADKLALQVGHVPSTPCRLNHEKFGPVDVEVTSRSIIFGGRIAWTCTPEKVLVLADHPNSASVDELLAFVSWSQAHLTNWFAHVRGLKFRMVPKSWNHLMFVMAERLGYRMVAQPTMDNVFERPASGWPTGTIPRGRASVRRASADVRRRQSVSPTTVRPAEVPRAPSQSSPGFRSTFPSRQPPASDPPTRRHPVASAGGMYYLFGDPAVLQEDVKAAFLESGLQIAGGSILRGGAPVGSFDGFCLHLSEPRRERAEIIATLSEVEVSQVPTAAFQYAESVRVSLDHGCRQATFSMNSSRAVWRWNSARQVSLLEAETTETGEWMLLLEYCEDIIAGWFGKVTGEC